MALTPALRAWATRLKTHTLTVYFAARDPRMPLHVRLLALAVAAYALSPIDLVPDFIPVLGLLDDLVIVPLGLALIIRLAPADVMADARARAAEQAEKPVSYVGAAAVVLFWAALLATCVALLRASVPG